MNKPYSRMKDSRPGVWMVVTGASVVVQSFGDR